MADFFVVFLTTLAFICLSLVFWKWITRRNEILVKERMRERVPAAILRENRLKRFDLVEDDSQKHGDRDETREWNSGVHFVETKESNGEEKVSNDNNITDEVQLTQRTSSGLNFVRKVENVEGGTENLVNSLQLPKRFVQQSSGNTKAGSSSKRETYQRLVTLISQDKKNNQSFCIPVTKPLSSLEELRRWNMGFDEFNVSTQALRRTSTTEDAKRSRTLVCHDMKGGYLEDRFIQGFPSSDCYRIYHWQYIDIFVYFSHNFITIPPPCWTNTAHKHGVQVLGTFITEWEDGAKRCAEIFADETSYLSVSHQLVSIAKYYNFDGWLVNIENPIQPAQINNLEKFLSHLTREMHEQIPGSLVIWYDSVTYNGDLKWQNELNPDNRIFFDATDGIFLNYTWNEANLTMSARGAGQERRYDVYVGVDVFGRGCFGGGGWNTNKATSVIKKHDLSTAIFAPGWVYENYQSNFKASQDKFWTSIAPDCSIHTLEYQLPFVTSFCQGYGKQVYKCGKVIYDKPWSHLGTQQIQPSYNNHIYSLGSQDGVRVTSMEHSCEDAFNGGGCLVLQGTTKPTQASAKSVVRLFKTNIQLPSTVLVSFTTKLESNTDLDVALQLHSDKKPTYIMLCSTHDLQGMGGDNDSLNEALLHRYGVTRSLQLHSDHLAIAVGQEHYRLFAPLTGDDHTKVQSLCCDGAEMNKNGWCTRYYLLAEKDLRNAHIKEIRLVLINKSTQNAQAKTASSQFKLFVGEVKILDAVSLRQPVPIVTSLHCREHEVMVEEDTASNTIKLSLTLSWSYKNKIPFEQFEIYYIDHAHNTMKFLGLSFVCSFFVSQLRIANSQNEVKFIVQAVDLNQRKLCLEQCPMITVHWT